MGDRRRVWSKEAITHIALYAGAKFPNATLKITDDRDQLLAFYDYCAMRRSVITPAQRGEMGGISLDLMAYGTLRRKATWEQ